MNAFIPVKLSADALVRRRHAGSNGAAAKFDLPLGWPPRHVTGTVAATPTVAREKEKQARRIIVRRVTVFDTDQLRDIIPDANIEHRLLEHGRFEARALHVETAKFSLDCLRYSAGMMLMGELPASGIALAFCLRKPEETVAFGIPQRSCALMLFDPAAGLDLRLPAGAEWVVVRLNPSLLQADSFRRGGDWLTGPVIEPRLLRIPGPQWRRVAARLRMIIDCAGEAPGSACDIERPDLDALLFDAVVEAYSSARVPQSNDHGALARRRRLVSRAEEYIYAHIDDSIRMKRLCRDIGASARTLEYAFKGIYGIGVMESMRTLRLNEVRKKLLRVGSEEVTVTTAAMDWGFWHLGEFAAGYKRLFGELPSQTLRVRGAGSPPREARGAISSADAAAPALRRSRPAPAVGVTAEAHATAAAGD